jgi:lysosomal acid phosphatase
LGLGVCAISTESLTPNKEGYLQARQGKLILDLETNIADIPQMDGLITPKLKTPLNPKVIMIAELFRHGARWTLYDIFNESDVEKNNGMLSPTGMRQHYNLGKAVRENYPDLFDENYNHEQITVTSSHVPRTVESAQSHLLGMYDMGAGFNLTTTSADFLTPPFSKNKSNVKSEEAMPFALPLGYRPIPIFAHSTDEDRTFMNDLEIVCPNAFELVHQFIDAQKPSLDKACLPISAALTAAGLSSQTMFDAPDFSLENIGQIFDYMKAYYFKHGQHHPQMTPALYSQIEIAYSVSFFSNWALPQIQKLWTHNLTSSIIKNFKSKLQDPTKTPLTYMALSGHDSNIASFWNILGVTNFACLVEELKTGKKVENCHKSIEYAANIIWELGSIEGKGLIRMVRDGVHMFGCEEAVTGRKGEWEGWCGVEEFERFAEEAFYVGSEEEYKELCGN